MKLPQITPFSKIFLAALLLFTFAKNDGAQTTTVGRPTLRWKYTTNDWVLNLAVGRDGTIYASTWTGNSIYALDRDGALKRTFTTGQGVSRLAVGSNGTVYVGCPNGISAFDPGGSLRWKLSSVVALVEGTNGSMYAIGPDLGTAGNLVYSIGADGTLKNTFAGGKPNVALLAVINDGTIYSGQYGVSAVTPSGDLKWSVSPGQGVTALAVGHDGVAYVGSHVAARQIRDPITGALRYVVGPSVPVVFALDPQTGSTIWSSNAPKGKIFAVKVGLKDAAVYVGSFDGNIYALDRHSGAVKWRFTTGSRAWGRDPVHALAIGGDGTIYAGSGASVEAISPP